MNEPRYLFVSALSSLYYSCFLFSYNTQCFVWLVQECVILNHACNSGQIRQISLMMLPIINAPLSALNMVRLFGTILSKPNFADGYAQFWLGSLHHRSRPLFAQETSPNSSDHSLPSIPPMLPVLSSFVVVVPTITALPNLFSIGFGMTPCFLFFPLLLMK